MSDPKNQQDEELQDLQPETEELTTEDAENVRGGVLIGLNQPSFKLNTAVKLDPAIKIQGAFGDGSV